MLWLTAILGGCDALEPPAPIPPSAMPAVQVEGPVWTAVVTTAPRAVPDRFLAGMPPSFDALQEHPEAWPPQGHLTDLACYGTDADRDALADLDPLFWDCDSPQMCAWAASGEHWGPLGGCPAVPSLASSPDLPDLVRLRWTYDDPTAGVSQALVEATERALATGQSWPGVLGLEVLGRSDSPEASDALRRLHRTAPPELRQTVAYAMWGRRESDLRRLHTAACLAGGDVHCGQSRTDPLSDVAAAVRDWRTDLDGLIERYPSFRSAIVTAIADCASDPDLAEADPWRMRSCLVALARQDRARAGLVAEGLADPYDVFGDVRAGLEAGGPEALRRRIEAAGFPPLGEPGDERPVTALDWLLATGHAERVGYAEDWPPEHERLLRRLARLAGLDDVVFLELMPDLDDLSARVPRATLYAYTGTLRFRTLANGDGGFDVEHSVGLINAILAHREADVRLAVSSSVSDIVVVAGPVAALVALEDDGFVAWQGPQPVLDPEAWQLDVEEGEGE